MIRVLLSAYGCDPGRGSESKNGWGWASALAASGQTETTVITGAFNRQSIEAHGGLANTRFLFCEDEAGVPDQVPGVLSSALRYRAFTRNARLEVARRRDEIDVAHHVSWTNIRLDSMIFAFDGPKIFGPVGGAQKFPRRFASELPPWKSAVELGRNVHVDLSARLPSVRRRLKSADIVVCGNAETASFARRAGAVRIEEMVNTAGSEQWRRPRQSLRRADEPLRLLSVGRLLGRKGTNLAIQAAHRAATQRPIDLTIVGGGDERARLEQITGPAKVNFTGQIPLARTREHYEAADALLFTSLRDSGAQPMVEAMEAGLPAIHLDHHGPGRYGRGGWAVPVAVTDPETTVAELAREIIALADDPQRLIDLATATTTRLAEISWNAHVERAIDWYASLTQAS